MRYLLFAVFLLFPSLSWAACDCGSTNAAAPCTGQSIVVTVVPQVDQSGTDGLTPQNNVYTWGFNSGGGDARCGQFASGDYWVAPAAGQTTVTMTSITGSVGTVAADVDPVMETLGLQDNTPVYGNYSAGQNIVPTLPQSYSGINSIVAATQRNEAVQGACGTPSIEGSCIDSYNVVTVLSSVPENAGNTVIRPNITGQTKHLLTWSDFDLTRVPSKSFLSGTDSAGFNRIKDRYKYNTEVFGLKTSVRVDGYSEGGRAFRAHIMIDDYGGGLVSEVTGTLLVLFSDDNTIEEKKPAIAAVLAFGLDLYASVFDPPPAYDRFWGQGATQSPGKFTMPAFMAALAIDTTYKTNLAGEDSHLAEYDERHGPHELGQVGRGTVERPLWGDNKYQNFTLNERSYWGQLFKKQRYDGAHYTSADPSVRESYDPYQYIDGPGENPNTRYAESTLGTQKALMALMYLMPGICEAVNSPRLINFVDRVTTYGKSTADDPCATPDTREPQTCAPYPSMANCSYYGVTWGPDPAHPGDCIKTATPPYTQIGRYASRDGDPVSISYTVSAVEANWATIRGTGPCGETPPAGPHSRGSVMFGIGQ